MILTVTPNPALDRALSVSNFRVGELVGVKEVHCTAGGKGINVARVLKLLGADAAVTGFSGGTYGEELERKLDGEGIRAYFANTSGGTRQSTTIIDSALGTETHLLEPGPSVSQEEVAEFDRRFLELLEKAEFVVFSGSLPPGVPQDLYRRMIRSANDKKVRTALDAKGRALKFGLEGKPSFIKPNRAELEEISGERLSSPEEIVRASKRLVDMGIDMVVVSLGGEGMIFVSKDDIFQAAPPQISVVSSVGSGDALLAGFLFSYLGGENLEDAIRLGMACGAVNCLKPASCTFGAKEMRYFQNMIEISHL